MKVVVFGASGYTGSNITAELLSRGIDTVGVARSVTKVPAGATATTGDVPMPSS